ncbi:MAG: hypothetical protein HFI90_06900 [Clostridia bacterium]|nr:hypothetical protein [Clostridia bacterium]
MKRKRGKKKNIVPMCENCENFIPIGEGDHICIAGMPIIVVEEYTPTEDYFWCKGKRFEAL